MRFFVLTLVLCSSTAFAQAEHRSEPSDPDRRVASVHLLETELEPPKPIGGPIALFVLGAGGIGSGIVTLGLAALSESDLMVAAAVAIMGAGVTMLAAGIGMLVRRVPRRRAARALSVMGGGLRW